MMKKDEMNREEQILATLNSLDGLQQAEVPPFFYTRLMGKIEAREKAGESKGWLLITRPAFSAAMLAIFVALNIFMLRSNGPEVRKVQKERSPLSELATEYNLNVNTLYNE